jgi:hypothetical protein
MDLQEAMELLTSVAEQLKFPLASISRQAELGRLTGDITLVDTASIQAHADAALTLVDSYLLGLQLLHDQQTLLLEPVSVSSTLVDIAHELDGFARHYDMKLELHIAGKYEPVMAHPRGLRAALISLGYALLESYPLEGASIRLAVHRTPHGIVTGVYGDYEQLKAKQWRQALALKGKAIQPFTALVGGSSAGLFVAEAILRAMETHLRVGKHLNQKGLATTLQPSQQLHFV